MPFPRFAMMLIFCSTLCIAGESFAAPPDEREIARLIKQLSDDNFQRREEASEKLWAAGQAAEPALRAATDSSDVEVSRRARDVLERFKWGVYPDTPKKVVELIENYRSSDRAANGATIRKLIEEGAPGCRAVIKIAQAEENADIRGRLFALITSEMARAVPMLLAENDLDSLSIVLETALNHRLGDGVGNYSAFWLLRGKLDDRIAYYVSEVGKHPDDKKNQEILAYLYRAKGNLTEALAAAQKSGHSDLVEAILLEMGNWKELCNRPIGTESKLDSERLGLRAAYCRLAGDKKGYEAAVGELRQLINGLKDDEALAGLIAKALFLNDRPEEAIECLVQRGDSTAAFEVQIARLRIREALKLADEQVQKNGKHAESLELLAARTRYTMGEKDIALSVLSRYGSRLNADKAEDWYETLVDAECRIGLKEQALEHVAKMMNMAKERNGERALLEKVFPKNGAAAEVWWDYLRQRDPSRDPLKILQEVSDIVGGKIAKGDVKGRILAASAALSSLNPRASVAEQWYLAMADLAIASGDEELGCATLEKSASSAAMMKLGDLAADRKQWQEAAEFYRRASEADRHLPLPLHLRGRALVMAGREAEGRRYIEQAHWLPLGDEQIRLDFAVALAQRGLSEASHRENEVLLRVSRPGSYYFGEAQRRIALEAEAHNDYLRSADGQERSMLRCLRINLDFVQPAANVVVPAMVHRHRARGLLAAGKLDAALAEAAICVEELPGDIDVPILLVPALDKAGRKKEADNLFAKVNSVLEDLVKQFPKSAWIHNSIAWTAACCLRDLDPGLTHAKKAVELEPTVAGFQDTLAEVYFQRGENKLAIEAQKKATELDPKKPYYRKQLKRMQGGDSRSPRPPEDDPEAED